MYFYICLTLQYSTGILVSLFCSMLIKGFLMMILLFCYSINYLICNIVVINCTKREREICGGMSIGSKKLEV